MNEASALRALGILGGEQLVRLMNRIREGDQSVEEDLRSMERAAGLMALTAPAADTPAELKRRVLSRIASEGYYFVRERESDWEPVSASGAYVRRLYVDARVSKETRIVRLLPSAPSDVLSGLVGPSFYVVSGEIQVEGTRLEIGDFFSSTGPAPLGRTDQGCVLYSVGAPLMQLRSNGQGGSNGSGRANGGASAARRTIVRAVEGTWIDVGGGAHTKTLVRDAARGLELSLLRMERGATWAAHHHDRAEEAFLLRGDWQCLGRNLHPGDYHRAGSGTDHALTTSRDGCKMVVAFTGSTTES
jgi:quercetin dioxygenase-like cupin family protein